MTTPSHEKLIERLTAMVAVRNPALAPHERAAIGDAIDELALRPAERQSCPPAGEGRIEFTPEEFAFLAEELRKNGDRVPAYRALMSNNYNVILAALARASASPPTVETAPVADGRASGITSEPDQPTCEDCDGEAFVWFAPNDLWNLVKGGPSATDDPGGILCPNCFIKRAEAQGLRPTAWRLEQEHIDASPIQGMEPGEHVSVEYDGFTGDVIGHYVTREGKRGVVVQQDGTRVVHVYGESRVTARMDCSTEPRQAPLQGEKP